MLLTMLMLLTTQDPETAVAAERAFNRAAQTQGQWTAFRQFMTDDAIVFTPQPVKAKEALPEKDPPIAVQWWPAESYVSCDGTMAVNTGPWVRPKGVGYFTTVWVRQADGHFKWVMDGGDALATPRALPEKPKVRRASCKKPPGVTINSILHTTGSAIGGRQSPDGTLSYTWIVAPDGGRIFYAHLWNGEAFIVVVSNEIAAPPSK